MKCLSTLLLILVAFLPQTTAATWYVKTDGSDANAGTNWGLAFKNLQTAIDAAATGDEIWVAAGTYLPNTPHDGTTERHHTFFIDHDVKIFGGFVGTETLRSQRNWKTHVTILSGLLGLPNDNFDNAYHVVWIDHVGEGMWLDGFLVTGGYANGNTRPYAQGGGIYNNGLGMGASNPTIQNCDIDDNRGLFGGGMCNVGTAAPKLTACTFRNNVAPNGGGLFNWGNDHKTVAPLLTDCVFENNSASSGGGLYNLGENGGTASPTLLHCTFTGNSAALASGITGGGMVNLAQTGGYASPILKDCAFNSNTGCAMLNDGLGPNANACSPDLERCTFTDNQSQQAGGAIIHNAQHLYVSQCTFTNNTAPKAGAIMVYEGIVRIGLSTFSGNKSTEDGGGAVYLTGATASSAGIFIKCVFSNNQAATDGGAVRIQCAQGQAVEPVLSECTFTGNTAVNGGAVFTSGLPSSYLYFLIHTCLFYQNTATQRGGAFCTGKNEGGGIPYFYNCTFYNNNAPQGGGVVGTSDYRNGQPNPYLKNCILWGNTSTFGQTASGQGGLTLEYSLIQEANCPAGATCGTGMVYAKNPLFLNVAANDFHLLACSPAVDAGNLTDAPGFDFDNMVRPHNAKIDMGAFEYQGPVCVPSFNISGRIIWKQDNSSGVKDVNVALTGGQTASANSSANGVYNLTVTAGTNFTLTPSKNTNKLNGVNASDVSRINQHLNGISLTNPWLLAAADVNGNNMISALDANILQLALLGNPSALSQIVAAWRFVPTSHVMSNPPWGFPEKITLTGVSGDRPNNDFYGFKVGDVTANYANPANFGTAKTLVFQAQDQLLEAGSEVSVEIGAGALSDLAAFQFALRFDPAQLQWVNVQPLGALPLSADNFGTFEAAEGKLRCVWAGAQAARLGEAAPVFRLTFKVLAGGQWLSEVLGLDEANLPGRAYNSQLLEATVQLRFSEQTSAVDLGGATLQVALQQNQPNPFVDQTTIGFILPEACTAQLRIVDGTGRVLEERTGAYPAGLNRETFQLSGLSGVLYYELTTPWGRLVKQMVGVQ